MEKEEKGRREREGGGGEEEREKGGRGEETEGRGRRGEGGGETKTDFNKLPKTPSASLVSRLINDVESEWRTLIA